MYGSFSVSTYLTLVQAAMKQKQLICQVLKRYFGVKGAPVYMLDLACFDHPEDWMRTESEMIEFARAVGISEESIQKQLDIYRGETLGVGPMLAYAPGILSYPPNLTIAACLNETRPILFQCAGKAMEAAGIKPREVDFVITTCTLFNPMPSMSSMIMNEFGMRSDCQNYSCAGMGCAGGVAMLALAQDLLTAHPGTVALVVAHENITSGTYLGENTDFLSANVLFHSGGAAAILSSRKKDRRRAKYQLMHTVRVNHAARKDAHECIQGIDTDLGRFGVYLNHPVIKTAAAAAIGQNLRRLGPLVLPFSEMIKAARNRDTKAVPNFSKAFKHVCIHPGARFVIEKVRKTLHFGERAAAPSHATLHRFGNTSGSSTFYILAYTETRVGIKKGDKVLQLGMGSGFKCCSAVWKALRHINTKHSCWEFRDRQPEHVPWSNHAFLKGPSANGEVELKVVAREASADLSSLNAPALKASGGGPFTVAALKASEE